VPILVTIRKRFTYPRIGYAKLGEEMPARTLRGIGLLTILMITVMAAILGYSAHQTDGSFLGLWRQWSPTLAGLLLAGRFIYEATVTGAKRYWAFAVLAIGLGIAFSLRFPQDYRGVELYLLTIGGLLFLHGAGSFIAFLRRFESPPEEGPDAAD
jgi:hypothetical protein